MARVKRRSSSRLRSNVKKPCGAGKSRNQKTGRCRKTRTYKPCPAGYVRSAKNRCVSKTKRTASHYRKNREMGKYLDYLMNVKGFNSKLLKYYLAKEFPSYNRNRAHSVLRRKLKRSTSRYDSKKHRSRSRSRGSFRVASSGRKKMKKRTSKH